MILMENTEEVTSVDPSGTVGSAFKSFISDQTDINKDDSKQQENYKKLFEEQQGIIKVEVSAQSVLSNIINEINKFTPARKYLSEDNYRSELFGFLKQKFPSAKIEVQVDSSRPDIAIDDVAIEIKGPTDSTGLNTLADKAMRYKKTWPHIIMVLFDIQVTDHRYDEWHVPFKNYYPAVVVIKK